MSLVGVPDNQMRVTANTDGYYDTLRENGTRIFPHTASLARFLASAEGLYSIFVLLDHMDWLAVTYGSFHMARLTP